MDHGVVSKASSRAPAMHSKDLYSVTCHDPNKAQEDEPSVGTCRCGEVKGQPDT